jgi:hypothetical protein
MADLQSTPLPATCEKRIWFVNPNLGDYAYSLTGLPQELAETDDETGNSTVLFARWFSINQLVAFKGPKGVLEHETYHLFGCGHYSMTSCYNQIQEFKLARAENIDAQLQYSKASRSEVVPNGSGLISLSPEVRGFVDDDEGFR